MAALHRFAKLTAACTLLLIAAGGLVTSTGSALSVPDWPLSFGKVLPPMSDGVVFEHSHRMIAAGVGILAVVLGIWLWRREPRRWVRGLGVAAVLLVIAQGVLGGVTVLMRLPLLVSVTHACMAQVFFCLVVTLALVTSEGWSAPAPPPRPPAGWPGLPSLCAATTGFLFLQLFLGALVRHTGSGLAIPDFPLAFGRLVPPVLEGQILIAYFHRLGAVVAGIYVLWSAGRILSRHRDEPSLVRPALALAGLLLVQLLLGGAVVWSELAVFPATAHVVTGALLLATSLVLTLRACRLAGGFGRSASTAPTPEPGRRSSPSWAIR
jgi:heme a synthase